MTAALACYGAALRRVVAGVPARLDLVGPAGDPVRRLNPAEWCGDLLAGDTGLVSRCTGPTLDVGCGPGRLAAAVGAAGLVSLGVDVSAEAVRQARRRGVRALRRCVFNPLPGEGRWRHVLLADGNIGIGGDPVRLLARCRDLLSPYGDILIEVDPPGAPSWRYQVSLTDGVRISSPFPWAAVSADDLAAHAGRAALRVIESWTEADRWFARAEPG